ncbi:peptidase family M1 [Phlyctema vagabunda]|uniref:Peptidase family M1 n=1 Tax=Phlyctema vagabunda TaxID=108571 RepID=A0ABR4PMH9_9HELO
MVSSEILPKDTAPLGYQIQIRVFESSFKGVVQIYIRANIDTKKIVLNSSELHISLVRYRPVNEFCEVKPEQGYRNLPIPIPDTKREQLHIPLDDTLDAGKIILLMIQFGGRIDRHRRGLSRSHERTGFVFYTSSHPTRARRIFPCYDEPEYRAIFSLALVVSSKDICCLSITPMRGERLILGIDKPLFRFVFRLTSKIPTHFLGFTIGRFARKVSFDGTSNGISMKFHLPVTKAPTQDPSTIIQDIMQYYNEFFGEACSIKDINLIGLSDVKRTSGICGLAMFPLRTLFPEPFSSIEELIRAFISIGDILAQQFCRTIFKIEPWHDIWLRRAMTVYVAMRCRHWLVPRYGWEQWEEFSVSRQLSLDHDSHLITRPLRHTNTYASEVSDYFDAMESRKGAAILLMVETHVGPLKFIETFRRLAKECAPAGVTTSDLCDAFEQATGKPFIRKYLTDWTTIPGYPIIDTKLMPAWLTLNGVFSEEDDRPINVRFVDDLHFYVKMRQERFVFPGLIDSPSIPWPIKLIQFDSRETPRSGRFEMSSWETTMHSKFSTSALLRSNAGSSEFARIAYDNKLWNILVLGVKMIDTPTRIKLLSDMTALSLAGYKGQNTTTILSFLETYSVNPYYHEWEIIFQAFDKIRARLISKNVDAVIALNSFRDWLVARHFDELRSLEVTDGSVHMKFVLPTMNEGLAALLLRNWRYERYINICRDIFRGRDVESELKKHHKFLPQLFKFALQDTDPEFSKNAYKKLYDYLSLPSGNLVAKDVVFQSLGYKEGRDFAEKTYQLANLNEGILDSNGAEREPISRDDADMLLKVLATHYEGARVLWKKLFKGVFQNDMQMDQATINEYFKLLCVTFSGSSQKKVRRCFSRYQKGSAAQIEESWSQIAAIMTEQEAWKKRDLHQLVLFLSQRNNWRLAWS